MNHQKVIMVVIKSNSVVHKLKSIMNVCEVTEQASHHGSKLP